MKDPYASLAAYYDLLIPDWDRAVAQAGERLDAILRPLGAVSVLDCTCGTGIHSIALAMRGYEVTGSDVSRPMLRKARQNARSAGVAVRWRHADIRSLRSAVQQSFDAVITCGSSLSHLVGSNDWSEAFASMFAVTREDGHVIIGIGSSDRIRRGEHPFPSTQIELPDGQKVSFFTTIDCSAETARLNVMIVRSYDGHPRVTHVPMDLRLPELSEVLDLLTAAGYDHISNLSDSDAITLLARKPSNRTLNSVSSFLESGSSLTPTV